MLPEPQPLEDRFVALTKDLIAEVVLEFYGDLDFLPKTMAELLQHYEKIGYLRDLDEYKDVYSAKNGAFLVLVEGDKVIGCGGLRRLDSDSAELVRLWLKKDQRKKGLGRKVFDGLLQIAEEKGYAKVYLDTSHRCTAAISLFRRNGFKECGQYKESIGDIFLCRKLRGDQGER